MNGLVKIHGGKHYIKQWVIDNFPINYESMTYVEPFVGSGSIVLNKKPSITEFINDKNEALINIYWCLRHHPTKFVNQLSTIEYTEQTFKEALSEFDFEDEIDEAVNEYILYRMSRGGMKKTFAWSNRLRGGIPGDINAWENSISNLLNIANRLKDVNINNLDFKNIISIYDNENIFMYLDPPYMSNTRVSKEVYDYEFTTKDHNDLLELILQSKAKILISGYDSFLYNTYLKDWNKHQKIVISNSGQTKVKGYKVEILWSNY